jgi:hypothetical protein
LDCELAEAATADYCEPVSWFELAIVYCVESCGGFSDFSLTEIEGLLYR